MRLHLITGFGLDRRAFAPLDLPPDKFVLYDLIPPRPGETLKEHALRMAEGMARSSGFGPGEAVGGISFGGMLALEMARALEPRGLVLIASTTHPRHIRKRFLVWSHLAPHAPDLLIKRVFALVPWVLKRQNLLTPEGQTLLTAIMTAFPADFLRGFPPMIRTWEGCAPAVPLRRIHSDGDWLIRLDGEAKDLTVVEGRNHLITVSHPEAVRKFLLDAYEEFAGEQLQEMKNEK